MHLIQNPDGSTIFGRLNRDYRIKFISKHLTSARDGQFDPERGGQGQRLFLLENQNYSCYNMNNQYQKKKKMKSRQKYQAPFSRWI